MEHYLFTFTAVVVILNVAVVVGYCCHQSILKWPHSYFLGPTKAIFAYPSMLYQMWYWSGVWGIGA